MPEWFEDDSFWEATFAHIFSAERFMVAESEVKRILSLTGYKAGRVLDLCCGPGRHSIVLGKMGIPVTGVDSSGFLLEKAVALASEQRLNIEFLHRDVRNFRQAGSYTLAINFFTSIGYFDNEDDNLRILRNVYESLTEDGTFLIETVGKEPLAKYFRATTSQHAQDGSTLFMEHSIVDDWSRAKERWTLVLSDKRVRAYSFEHTVYSGAELKALLRFVGFSEIRLFGDLNGRAYDTEAERLIAVARRSKSAHKTVP